MLKLKADAQPAGGPVKSHSAAVRIEGVSAPKNMKIGLVTASLAASAGKSEVSADKPAVAPVKLAEPAKGSQTPAALSKTETAKRVLAEQKAASGSADAVPDLGGTESTLPKLALAAAGLAVASAMLLYFQFSSGPADEGGLAGSSAAQVQTAENGGGAPALAAAGREGTVAASEDELVARITAGTLAALRSKQIPSAETGAAPAAPAESTALFKMVMTASAQGQSEAYIDQLVNGAYERQEISVPASLIGADGRVDTATLLALFVGN